MKHFKQKDDLFKVEKWKLLVFYTIVLGLMLLSVILPISKQYLIGVRAVGICFLSIFVFLFASLIAHVCMQGNENRIKKIVLIALQGLVVGICVAFINLYDSLLIKMEFAIGAVMVSFIVYQLFNFYAYTMDKICEKLFRILLTFSILFIAVGTVLGFVNASWYFVFTKIGLGFMYFWIIVELMKRTLFNEKYSIKEELKKNSYYVAFTVLLYVVLIFTFPMYVAWCGLNGKNFEYFITLYSCAIGGVITLGGVAWGIRNGKNEKKEEEIKKAKPVVFICSSESLKDQKEKPVERILLSQQAKGTLKMADSKHSAYLLPEIVINNSDYSHAVVKGFKINNDYHLYDIGQVLSKNSTLKLKNHFRFKYNDEINYVAIILQDMLDNIYELQVNYEIEIGFDHKIKIISGLDIVKTNLPLNPKEI